VRGTGSSQFAWNRIILVRVTAIGIARPPERQCIFGIADADVSSSEGVDADCWRSRGPQLGYRVREKSGIRFCKWRSKAERMGSGPYGVWTGKGLRDSGRDLGSSRSRK
jgi:hypothetical protein